MNSICVATGCLDVQTPVKISFKNLYQWPESEAEFLNKLIITMNNEENSPSTAVAAAASPCFSHQKPSSIDHHESFVCRQRYLRSYTFSKQKETVTEKTKRWIKEKQEKKKKNRNIHDHHHHHHEEKSSKDDHIGSGGSSSTTPCSSFKSAFLFLLSCMVRVDVHDDQL